MNDILIIFEFHARKRKHTETHPKQWPDSSAAQNIISKLRGNGRSSVVNQSPVVHCVIEPEF